MGGDEDTIMEEGQRPPPAPSSVLTLPPLTTPLDQIGSALASSPSAFPQISQIPGASSLSTQPTLVTGMPPPPDRVKMSDSESNSLDNLVKRDSLVETNSDWSDDETAVKSGLPVGSLATGLCYDVRMRYHCEVRPTTEVHPEDPRRIYYIFKELCRAGLVDDPDSVHPLAPQTLKRIAARNATEDEITLIHSQAHYAFVKSTSGKWSICF